MKTIVGWILFLSLIAVPIYKYILDWQSCCIRETFESEYQLYGVTATFDYNKSFRLNQDYWKHHRVAYLPFVYRKKSVSIYRYVYVGQYKAFGRIKTYNYHGNINIIL